MGTLRRGILLTCVPLFNLLFVCVSAEQHCNSNFDCNQDSVCRNHICVCAHSDHCFDASKTWKIYSITLGSLFALIYAILAIVCMYFIWDKYSKSNPPNSTNNLSTNNISTYTSNDNNTPNIIYIDPTNNISTNNNSTNTLKYNNTPNIIYIYTNSDSSDNISNININSNSNSFTKYPPSITRHSHSHDSQRRRTEEEEKSTKMRTWFYPFMCASCILKMVYQIILASYPAILSSSAKFDKLVSGSFFIPSFSYICSNACYIILLLSWSQLYFQMSDAFSISYIQNGFVIGILISFLFNVAFVDEFVYLSVLLSTVFFLLISIAFLVMCFLMRRKVHKHNWLQVKAKVMHKINYCTFLASVFMLLRVVFDCLEIVFPTWSQNYFVYPVSSSEMNEGDKRKGGRERERGEVTQEEYPFD